MSSFMVPWWHPGTRPFPVNSMADETLWRTRRASVYKGAALRRRRPAMRFSEEEEMLVRRITLTVVSMSAVLCLACSNEGSQPGGDESGAPDTPNSAAGPAKPGTSDPCALLTQADATELFGKPAATYKG